MTKWCNLVFPLTIKWRQTPQTVRRGRVSCSLLCLTMSILHGYKGNVYLHTPSEWPTLNPPPSDGLGRIQHTALLTVVEVWSVKAPEKIEIADNGGELREEELLVKTFMMNCRVTLHLTLGSAEPTWHNTASYSPLSSITINPTHPPLGSSDKEILMTNPLTK